MAKTNGKVRNNKGQFTPKVETVANQFTAFLGTEEGRSTRDLIENAFTTRSQLMRRSLGLDPRRDIDHECGYPKTESITNEDYRVFFDRESIATRVVELMPQECWGVQPSIFETDDIANTTPFESSLQELGSTLQGEGWLSGDNDSALAIIWDYLQRVDILSGIGSYGVILLGLGDGLELNQPAKMRKDQKLLFVRTFDERLAQITASEVDVNNPRFGQPTQYSLTFNDPNESNQSGIGFTTATMDVHWTRIVHVADNLGVGEIFGVPRMRPVFNRLSDLRKLFAGSAEMYWKGAFPGLSIETHPQLGADIPELSDPTFKSAMRDMIENYENGLQRYLAFTGMSVKSLAPQVVDPSPQINTQIEAICIKMGVPKRIFTGSERGELASSQDSLTWNKRISHRQNMYLTPRVIAPFIDKLISLGVLPQPQKYSVVWPDLESLTEQEQAAIALTRTEAFAKYIQGDVVALVPEIDYLTRIHKIPSDDAEAIIKATKEVEDDNRLLGDIRSEDDKAAFQQEQEHEQGRFENEGKSEKD